jgi:tetratricopeptide (TPR) repeat protein
VLDHAGATAGPARAKALRGRGLLRVRQGLLAEAEADGRELLALAEDANDGGLRAQALNQLARVVHTRGDYEQARRLYDEVASLSRLTGDTTLVGIALGMLADVALNESRFEDAAALAGEALEIGRAAGNVERVATSLDNLGSALLGLGRIEEAADHFAEALRGGREIRDAEAIAYALEGLGAVAAAIGHLERAARLLGAAGATLTAVRTDLQDFEAHRHQQIVARLHRQTRQPNVRRRMDGGPGDDARRRDSARTRRACPVRPPSAAGRGSTHTWLAPTRLTTSAGPSRLRRSALGPLGNPEIWSHPTRPVTMTGAT